MRLSDHSRRRRAARPADGGFDLTQVQAEAILNMRLRALRKLEETAIRAEHAELVDECKALKNF